MASAGLRDYGEPAGYYLAVVRVHAEIGCLRFYEHYAYAFDAAPPFAVLARSARPLPLAARSFAAARGGECRAAESWRVATGRAKFAAGATANGTHLAVSYSAGADWTPRVWTAPLDDVEAALVAVAPRLDDLLVACDGGSDCAVLAAHGDACAAERGSRR